MGGGCEPSSLPTSNDDGTRWLDVENGKHRFHSDVAGVNFTPQKVSLEAIDVFGEKESLIAAFGVPHLIKSSLFSTQSKEEKVKQLLLNALSELTEKMNKEFVSKKALFEKAKADLKVVASKSKLTGVNFTDGLNALCVTGEVVKKPVPKGAGASSNQKEYYELSKQDQLKYE